MKLILFGAGISGQRFLIDNLEANIYEVWDTYKSGYFFGYRVQKPYHNKDFFIVVAANNYVEMKEQLINYGYVEFEDFICAECYKKKIAICYGNCHAAYIKDRLENIDCFNEIYGFYPIPAIQQLNIEIIDDNILANTDLFLYQDVRKENKYGEQYAAENLVQRLTTKCEKVCFPNLYGMPKFMFPQFDENNEYIFDKIFINNDDLNIRKWVEENKSFVEIKKLIIDGGTYSTAEILEGYKLFTQLSQLIFPNKACINEA